MGGVCNSAELTLPKTGRTALGKMLDTEGDDDRSHKVDKNMFAFQPTLSRGESLCELQFWGVDRNE